MELSPEKIAKFREIYANSTSELAKKTAKEKLEEAGVSLTEAKKAAEPISLSQEKIDKFRYIYANSTSDLAKKTAKEKLEEAGVSLSEKKTEPKAPKAPKEPKVKAPKEPKAPKAPTEAKKGGESVEGYDCTELVAKVKERKAKAKIAAAKRAAAPKKSPATKNKETVVKTAAKVEKSIVVRAKKGAVNTSEIEKLIKEYEDAIKKLKALLTKIKSGKKFAKGGAVDEVDAESANEFHEIKEHSCACGDGKYAKGGALNSKSIRNKKVWISEQGRRPNFHTTAILTQKTFEETKKQFNDDSKWEIERTDEDMYTWVRKEDGYVFALRLMEIFEDGGVISDKKFSALKAGERTSRKYANVEMKGGRVYHRRNANQFGKVKGGNEYSESRDNRTDRKQYFENGGEIESFKTEIKKALKENNKWHFINSDVNGKNVQIKMFVGLKEVDVQIFKINGIHHGKNNYQNKTKTLEMILNEVK